MASTRPETGEIHLVPTWDLHVHQFVDCACDPQPDDEAPEMIIHMAFDGREAYEAGERKRH